MICLDLIGSKRGSSAILKKGNISLRIEKFVFILDDDQFDRENFCWIKKFNYAISEKVDGMMILSFDPLFVSHRV